MILKPGSTLARTISPSLMADLTVCQEPTYNTALLDFYVLAGTQSITHRQLSALSGGDIRTLGALARAMQKH
jgi:hypothetical protein